MLPLSVCMPRDGTMILSISKFRIVAFSITTFGIMALCISTSGILTLNINDNQHNYTLYKGLFMTSRMIIISIKYLFATLSINDTQYIGIQHNNTQHDDISINNAPQNDFNTQHNDIHYKETQHIYTQN